MKALLLATLLVCQVAPSGRQRGGERGPPAAGRHAAPGWQRQVLRLIRSLQRLDPWDQHYACAMAALEKVYQRNGWDSEADTFSLDLIREVEAIPPWELQERFDTFVGLLSDRYLLDAEQEESLRRTIAREGDRIFARHAGRIMQYAGEVIVTRAAGGAITAEQVARWTRLARPVFADTRRRLKAAAARFLEQLTPEQRELVQRDLAAAERRMERIEALTRRWARGDWTPKDWGIENDPIQLAGEARAAAQAAGAGSVPPGGAPRGWGVGPAAGSRPAGRAGRGLGELGAAEGPWARYVRAFIGKYKLSGAQQQRAWVIYRGIKQHADRVRQRYAGQIGALRRRLREGGDQRVRAALQAQVRRRDGLLEGLFGQLRRRLGRLPTSAQRRDAEPGRLEAPAGSATERHPSDGP